MRAITKQGSGGYQLGKSHANPPLTGGQATSRWSSFVDKVYLLQSLLDEQYQLCCYSELRADELGLGYHIEHVENKSQNPLRTFDYMNLAASALDSENDLRVFGSDAFGGHALGKKKAVDMNRFVSCHQSDSQRFFAYLSDGRVVASKTLDEQDTDKANYTIDLLNLNSPYLIIRRGQWWAELEQLFQEHQEKGWSLDDLVGLELVPSQSLLRSFFSLTRQFFGTVAERTLQQHAPKLL